jgi:hypothetical protein
LRIGTVTTGKVDRLSCLRFGSARYSVPTRLIGHTVELRNSGGRLLLVETPSGEILADHALVAPGEVLVVDDHYGGPRPAPRRAVRPRTVAEKAFCALGPIAEAFITGAAAAGHTRLGPNWSSWPRSRRGMGAMRCWPRWSGRSPSAGGARPMWLHPGRRCWHSAAPPSRGGALVLELPMVPTRPLSDYAIRAWL